MAFKFNAFRKKKEEEKPISTKQISVVKSSDKNIFPDNQKTMDLLKAICTAPTKYAAVDAIIEKTPDGKMAYNTYLRLANQGFDIELRSKSTGRIVKKYDEELREFCQHVGKNNSCGLDGLVDQLHGSAISRGGMAVEIVVDKDVTDIDEVFIVDPATFVEYKWLEDKKRYAIYQMDSMGKKVDLYDGNFIWVPHQPKPGRPDGTLQFEPAIATVTEFYQLIQDSMRVLNRIGYPRYKCTIDREALLASATPAQRSSADAQRKFFQDAFNQVEEQMRQMGKDNDLITFDSNNVDILGGGVNGAGIDVRAWFEVLEPLVVNSFQLTPVLMGRLSTGSYSLGTAEYQIVCDTIDTMRRASKRVLEAIINMWARVHGYNVTATVTHHPIDWQTELDKLNVQLKEMEKARRAEEYRWINHNEAAQIGLGVEKASEAQAKDEFEYIKKAQSTEKVEVEEDEEEGKQKEPKKNNKERGSKK